LTIFPPIFCYPSTSFCFLLEIPPCRFGLSLFYHFSIFRIGTNSKSLSSCCLFNEKLLQRCNLAPFSAPFPPFFFSGRQSQVHQPVDPPISHQFNHLGGGWPNFCGFSPFKDFRACFLLLNHLSPAPPLHSSSGFRSP